MIQFRKVSETVVFGTVKLNSMYKKTFNYHINFLTIFVVYQFMETQ